MYSNPEQEPLLNNKDNEFQNEKELEDLINKQIRKGFIVKVYSILLVQLLTTSLFIFLAFYFPSFKSFLIKNTLVYILAVIIILATFPILLCFSYILKQVPHNYIFLGFFTLAESYLISLYTCEYTGKSVLIALILTLTTVLTLTYYAWTSKKDFTVYGGVFFCLITLSIVGSLILIFVKISFLNLLMDIFTLLLFSGYIIYDTQLIVRNDTQFQFSPDDYILASLNLYLDIINIFLQFLSIFGNRN